MTIDRRKLFALGGMGIVATGGTGALGAEVNPAFPGITIQIRLVGNGWEVAVPDWEHEAKMPVHQGYLMPVTWMPLPEFLETMKGDRA